MIDLEEILTKHIPNVAVRGNHLTGGCPICGKEDKFYLNMSKALEKGEDGNYIGSWDCKRGEHSGSIFTLFRHLNLLSLLTYRKTISDAPTDFEVISLHSNQNAEQEQFKGLIDAPISVPPYYKKVTDNKFLTDRGWGEKQYQKYDVYEANNYVFISLKQKGIVVGLLGRATKSKEEIAKTGMRKFMNSRVDFSRIVGGFDEITEKTEHLIVVEGIFDKEAVDNKLNLHEKEKTVCVFVFGKSMKSEQVEAISFVPNVWILFDGDAIESSIKLAKRITPKFETVKIVQIGDLDPDDAPKEDLIQAFKDATDYTNVFTPIKL